MPNLNEKVLAECQGLLDTLHSDFESLLSGDWEPDRHSIEDSQDNIARVKSLLQGKAPCAQPLGTKKEIKMLTLLPFCGFYYSIHEDYIDAAIAAMVREEEQDVYDWDDIPRVENWGQRLDEGYAKLYTEAVREVLADYLSLKGEEVELTFVELTQPREYNFETDKITAEIKVKHVKRLLDILEIHYPGAFKRYVEYALAPRDGFIPYYSNDLSDWPDDLEDWTEAQVGLLLECLFIEEEIDGGELMEDSNCNGELDRLLENCLTPAGLDVLDKINSLVED